MYFLFPSSSFSQSKHTHRTENGFPRSPISSADLAPDINVEIDVQNQQK